MADNTEEFDLDALIEEMAENEEEQITITSVEGGVSEAKSKSGVHPN